MNDKLKRILIVDDSPDDIHFVMEHFSDDYAVIAATSGKKSTAACDQRAAAGHHSYGCRNA